MDTAKSNKPGSNPGEITSKTRGGGRPASWSSKFQAVLAAVLISGVALYWNSSSNWLRPEMSLFQFNVSRPLPSSTYAVCSPEGSSSIYVVDKANTRVECVLVDQKRVVYTGSLERVTNHYNDIKRERGCHKSLEVVKIPMDAIVVPGLTDSHCHILEYGASHLIPLQNAKSAKEAVDIVAEYVRANPPVANDPEFVIEGFGWDHEAWDVPKFPTSVDFDAHPGLVGRQIVLVSKDGHASWVSSTTLAKNGPYPAQIEGGKIVRDARTGEPTGIFMDTAQSLIELPVVTTKGRKQRFAKAVHDALSVGLVTLHDAGFKPESLEFFSSEAASKGGLPMRIYGMSFFNASSIPSDPSAYWGDRQAQISDLAGKTRLSNRGVKIFGDGALRTAGAALYEPYADDPTTSGQMRMSAKVLNDVVPRFLKDGWQVNVHAIGDRANGMVLDAFEVALKDMGLTTFEHGELRPRLEHAQIIAPNDVGRLARMGVIASVQPTHAISDMWYGEDRLGPERVKNLYPFQSILAAGGRVALGSDFPVEDINPLAGFHAAIARLSKDGKSPHGPGGWFPEQRLTRIQALRGMTIDPAYASLTEDALGSLEVGKKADFVVLSQDIMRVPVDEILATRVLATVIDGRVVYGEV